MPAIRPVRVSCTSSTARETPKSVSFTRPSSAMSTLPGLTSRCTTPAACAAASPSATCRPISATTRGSSGPFSVSIAGERLARQVLHDQPRPVLVHDDVEHADHVRVLQAGPDPPLPHEPLARLLQRVAAGRRGRLGAPSSSLTATVRFSSSSVPRQTTPIAPAPIRWSSRYRLPIRGASSAGALIAAQDILRPSTTCRRGRSVRAGFTTSLPRPWRSAVVHRSRRVGLILRSDRRTLESAARRSAHRAGREQGTRCGSRTSSATRASRCTRHCRGSRWRKPPSGSTDADVGALVVCDGERRIRGIVSERDIVRGLSRRGAGGARGAGRVGDDPRRAHLRPAGDRRPRDGADDPLPLPPPAGGGQRASSSASSASATWSSTGSARWRWRRACCATG